MDVLNEDCLRNVFSYFPLKERMKLEQVCRRWKRVMPYNDGQCKLATVDILSLIKWKAQHVVKVKHGPCLHCEYDSTAFIRQSSLLEGLIYYLSRLGKYVNGVSFNSSCPLACLITPELLEAVKLYTKNETRLELDRCVIMDSSFKYLQENYQISALTMKYCTFIDADQCVVIDGSDLIQNIISKSSQYLQTLDLRGVKRARLQFSECYQNRGNLIKLALSDCYTMAGDFKLLISQNSTSLREVEISACGSISRFDSVSQLRNLISFTLRQSMISVTDFTSICQNCKSIRRLHVEACPRLVDLTAVKEVKRTLKHFSVVGRSMRIGDHVLEGLVDGGVLESLEIMDCIASDETFRRMIPFAQRLTSFMVKGTGISDMTFEDIASLVKRNGVKA